MKRSFDVEHLRVTVTEPEDGAPTFRVDPIDGDPKKPLFTGFVHKGMSLQLLLLADHLDEVEKRLVPYQAIQGRA